MSDSTNDNTTQPGGGQDDDTTSTTDDSSVGFNHQIDDADDSDASLQDAHNPETDEDTTSGGPAD